jgi:uncharacterized RDD family membrane protein YckC
MQWHYLHNGQTIGPISEQDLETLIKVGTLAPEVMVWADGMPDWQPYSTVKAPALSAIATAPSPGLRIAPVTDALPPEIVPDVGMSTSSRKPIADTAPLGHRIVAKLIDFAAFGICVVVFVVIAQWIWTLTKQTVQSGSSKAPLKTAMRVAIVAIGFLLAMLYRKTSENIGSSRLATGRRSPGKNLMKLYVVDLAGRPLSFSTKLARFLIQLLMVGGVFFPCLFLFTAMTHYSNIRPPPRPPTYSYGSYPPRPAIRSRDTVVEKFLLGVAFSFALSQAGYAVALFNRQRRGLHDLLCGTRVIHAP